MALVWIPTPDATKPGLADGSDDNPLTQAAVPALEELRKLACP